MTKQVLLPFLRAPAIALAAPDKNLLENADFSERSLLPWKLETLHGAQAEAEPERLPGGKHALKITVAEATEQPYYINLFQPGLALEAGKTYNLTFRAKASEEVTTSLNTLINEDPWEQIWTQDLPLTTRWEDYSFDIIPSQSTEIGRLTFGRLGKAAATYWFAEVTLTPAR